MTTDGWQPEKVEDGGKRRKEKERGAEEEEGGGWRWVEGGRGWDVLGTTASTVWFCFGKGKGLRPEVRLDWGGGSR